MRGYENYRQFLAPRAPCHVAAVELPYRLFATDAEYGDSAPVDSDPAVRRDGPDQ